MPAEEVQRRAGLISLREKTKLLLEHRRPLPLEMGVPCVLPMAGRRVRFAWKFGVAKPVKRFVIIGFVSHKMRAGLSHERPQPPLRLGIEPSEFVKRLETGVIQFGPSRRCMCKIQPFRIRLSVADT